MPNSYESREPLFPKNGERPFYGTIIVNYHCTQLSNDYFLLGASICTRVRPGAPGCTQFCTHPTSFYCHFVILCYDALCPEIEKSPKPLVTRDFEDCTQR